MKDADGTDPSLVWRNTQWNEKKDAAKYTNNGDEPSEGCSVAKRLRTEESNDELRITREEHEHKSVTSLAMIETNDRDSSTAAAGK